MDDPFGKERFVDGRDILDNRINEVENGQLDIRGNLQTNMIPKTRLGKDSPSRPVCDPKQMTDVSFPVRPGSCNFKILQKKSNSCEGQKKRDNTFNL